MLQALIELLGHGVFNFVVFLAQLSVTILVIALLLLWRFQGLILYLPDGVDRKRQLAYNPHPYCSPANFGTPASPVSYDNLMLRTADGLLIHAFLLKAKENPFDRATIVYFHGNAGNIGHRLDNAMHLQQFTGANVLLVDYRGYGNSEGSPTEKGLELDAEACLEYLRENDFAMDKIFAFGRSLGGAVAIKLASRHPELCGLMVENTFTSIEDMFFALLRQLGLKRDLDWIRKPLRFFLRSRWPSEDLIKDVPCPILFLSGLKDELIPPDQMRRLQTAAVASRNITFETFADGTHNDTFVHGGQEYYLTVRNFVLTTLQRAS